MEQPNLLRKIIQNDWKIDLIFDPNVFTSFEKKC